MTANLGEPPIIHKYGDWFQNQTESRLKICQYYAPVLVQSLECSEGLTIRSPTGRNYVLP